MSTISIQFEAIGDSAVNGGYIEIGFNNNTVVTNLRLTSKNGPSVFQFFSAIPTDIPTDPDEAQANAFAFSFNRDYKNVGGTNNLSATVVDDVVTITAIVGTFDTYAATGDFSTNIGIVNSPQIDTLTLAVTKSASTGNCSTIQYSAVTIGGVAPYALYANSVLIDGDWDGTSTTFNLPRGQVCKVVVEDDADNSKSSTFPVPRILAAGDFSITQTTYETSADILINRDIVIAGLTPLQYSLDENSETTGQDYQTSNAFSGVPAGVYKLFIKDVYGCEIVKAINVTGFQDAEQNEIPIYFDIPQGQSFLFAETPEFSPSIKKNYFNTGSYNELSQRLHKVIQVFDPSDNFVGTQFKSSYTYHFITLNLCDGTQIDVPSVMIQENLGNTEKMDCTLFPIEGEVGKTGVYFQGGNTYIPDTNTVLGTNTFDGTTPTWAKIDQLVFIDGIGGVYIENTGYDSIRGGYFVVSAETVSEIAGKIQVTYNKHPYNLFEFYTNINLTTDKAFLVIEKGFEEDTVEGNPWISEVISKKNDDDDRLLIEWSDSKNKGDIVYQSGITFKSRQYGEFLPDSEEVSETYSGDSNEYSLEQKSHIGFELFLEGISFKQVMQMNIASSLDNFKVNGLLLVRKSPPEKNRYGKSNLYNWRGKFAFGANQLAIKQDEIVLSVGTGVVGGGSTGKNPIPDLSGITLIKLSNGSFITMGGNIIKNS